MTSRYDRVIDYIIVQVFKPVAVPAIWNRANKRLPCSAGTIQLLTPHHSNRRSARAGDPKMRRRRPTPGAWASETEIKADEIKRPNPTS
jgi:hypothetical protein